jgi:RHS repeat-associated protein
LDGASPPNITANLLTGLGIDEYFSRNDSSGSMSFLRDALGSTMALTDNSGALDTQYAYEPFGTTSSSGPANANPYQFTGRENDGTGLYSYRARYYSPALHRFIGQDPIEFRGGELNGYTYAANNPADLIDPLGLEREQ